MSNDQLYRKHGNKYVPVGYEFTGFPCNGVWLVTEEPGVKSRRCIAYLSDAPAPLKLASIARYEDALSKILVQYLHDSARAAHVIPSAQDIANFTIKQLAQLLYEEEVESKQARGEGDRR